MRYIRPKSGVEINSINSQPAQTNYLIGNDPTKWRTNIPQYARVEYHDLYPGIDLVYYGKDGQLEFDLIVAKHANPNLVQLEFKGTRQRTSLDSRGNLVIGDLRLLKPYIYQEINGAKKEIAGGYLLKGRNRVKFHIAKYDHSLPLIIDPVITYSTYLGGNSDEVAYATAVDSAGNAYVAGYTTSLDFPASASAYKTASQGGTYDAFVAKYGPTGALIYTTYLGGSDDDVAYGIAVDSANNVYVTGSTASTDFPTSPGAFRTSLPGGGTHAFVVKLNAAGNAILYSSFLGGSGDDIGYGIAIDSSNTATMTGSTSSTDFPITPGAYKTSNSGGIRDAFVTRMNAAGTALAWSTYLGGSGEDVGYGVALDSLGNTYVTGYTASTDFPATLGSAQPSKSAGFDAFVTALNPSGTAPIYSTFLGGSNQDFGLGIAVDGSANAYMTGYTTSSDYPHSAGSLQTAKGAGTGYDAVVTKLSPSGAVVYSTFLGGSGDDFGMGIAVDPGGNAYVTGDTSSTDFPVFQPVQAALGGIFNAFVTQLNPAGTVLKYSTWIGGSGFETGYGIAVDQSGTASVVGYTVSPDFPVGAGAVQKAVSGGSDAFAVRLAWSPWLSIGKTHSGNFSQGQTGAIYTIAVSNAGQAATAGEVTVTDTLPTGMTGSLIAGTGWTCVLSTLTCKRSDTLNAGSSYPAIAVTVNLAANAPLSMTNQAAVAGGGSPVNTASDVTAITARTSQTITFAALGDVTFGAAPFAVSASASSGLPVSFASSTTPVCTISGGTVTIVAAGACSDTASQNGNATYSPATTVTRNFVVNAAPQTIAFGALGNLTLGSAPFALSATASSGLAVSFASSSPSVCTVNGSTAALVSVGNCAVTASQAGNGSYAAATPVTRTFTVLAPGSLVTLTVGNGAGTTGGTVELPVALATAGTAAASGFQMDLGFDAAKLSFVSARVGEKSTAAGKGLSSSTLPNGQVRLLVSGINQNAIAAGNAAYASFQISGGFTSGTSAITAANCASTDIVGNALITSCTGGSIKYASCDINADGSANVSDVQLIINEALGVLAATHDLNSDGLVNVADVQIVINAALGLGCNVR